MSTAMKNQDAYAWKGNDVSQLDLMEGDTVLVLDPLDEVIGAASKKDSHVFSLSQPYGVLHRAFSVFAVDTSTNKLLLQQRAGSKITFPNVWTNTCCSHPLHGMSPNEVDAPEDVASGNVLGVKHAARRKIHQELGIPLEQINVNAMVFVTRLRYWAADTVTHGLDAPWGENEIDYVLFWPMADAANKLTVAPHPDEVQAVKWVSPDELKSMQLDPNLLFSPWFRLICQRWLEPVWWKDLDGTLAGKYGDYVTIHAFDPPSEHFGGAGRAKPLFLTGDESKKQGGYGKIPTHQESKLMQMVRVDEVFAALSLLYVRPLRSNLDSSQVLDKFPGEDLAFCDEVLEKVSRSFAAVIRQLPPPLLVDILVFYLVLRALDTIEDDTSAFHGSHEVKITHLMAFHSTALQDKTWSMSGVGQGDERRLLENFPKVHAIYRSLSLQSQLVISDITQRMATGMAEFVSSDLGQGTNDIAQYNRYCHFVAGLVGEGLSRLFAASELEAPSLASELHLSDQMGLFLQKTNIIRDYLEDFVDKRAFWPQSVWKKYSTTGDLGFFVQQTNPTARKKSLECLNELVADALELAPDCLAYMAKLRCREIFRFCAIPQVMAIATLEKCYNNPDVFTGVVKIRKGLSCKLILRTESLDQVHEIFNSYATLILRQVPSNDPSYKRTVRACEAILELTEKRAAKLKRQRFQAWTLSVAVPIMAILSASFWSAPSTAPPSIMSPLTWLGSLGIISFGTWRLVRS